MIRLLAEAKRENRRLEMERELADVRARNRALRGSDSLGTTVGSIALGGVASPILGAPLKAKTMRPKTIRPYKGLSEGEHTRWFRDVDV